MLTVCSQMMCSQLVMLNVLDDKEEIFILSWCKLLSWNATILKFSFLILVAFKYEWRGVRFSQHSEPFFFSSLFSFCYTYILKVLKFLWRSSVVKISWDTHTPWSCSQIWNLRWLLQEVERTEVASKYQFAFLYLRTTISWVVIPLISRMLSDYVESFSLRNAFT